MSTKLAVIGDRFMQPEVFVAALQARVDAALELRTRELPWPDEPMQHGYAGDALEGLTEFMGRPEDFVELLDGVEILVNHLAPVTGWLLDRCPKLRLIAVARGGPTNIDMAAARARGVAVVNAPGRNASAVAEFTIGAILAETRLIRLGHESLRQGIWRGDLYRADMTGDELCEKTVGIIGYGHIGTRVVRLLKPFGCRILVDDPYVPLSEADRADGVEAAGLERLLEQSDVVSLHARVTPETRGFLAAPQFARMKAGAYFINTARGTDGRLRGAAPGARERPSARRHARDLLAGAAARRCAAAQACQRHAHPAHRRRLPQDGEVCSRPRRRRGRSLSARRAVRQPLLSQGPTDE